MVVYDDMIGLIDPYGDVIEVSAIIENGWVFMLKSMDKVWVI